MKLTGFDTMLKPRLDLRESADGQLWLDDGELAIAMTGMSNDRLAETDMRLYADGEWDVGDCSGVELLSSHDVAGLPVIATFRDDEFTPAAYSEMGPAGRAYTGCTAGKTQEVDRR